MMTRILDETFFRKFSDPSGMLDATVKFPAQWKEAAQIGYEFDPPEFDFDRALVVGMGGSAIGGELAGAYLAAKGSVQVTVNRGYHLPKWVHKKTLIVASSYSGNTAETLSCVDEARKKKCPILGITQWKVPKKVNKLAEVAEANGIPLIRIRPGLSPRAALGYSFVPLLIAFSKLGMVPDVKPAVSETHTLLRRLSKLHGPLVPTEDNLAKQLAVVLYQRLPIIYGGQGPFETIAYRWRCQFNENSKSLAISHGVPEMNHNEIVGWENPMHICQDAVVCCLLDRDDHPEVKERFSIIHDLIEHSGAFVFDFASQGKSLIARMFSLIYLGDFVSVYLALREAVDPSPVRRIDLLKARLDECTKHAHKHKGK
jgi:glucose/mannose-6-phosphate isomerase